MWCPFVDTSCVHGKPRVDGMRSVLQGWNGRLLCRVILQTDPGGCRTSQQNPTETSTLWLCIPGRVDALVGTVNRASQRFPAAHSNAKRVRSEMERRLPTMLCTPRVAPQVQLGLVRRDRFVRDAAHAGGLTPTGRGIHPPTGVTAGAGFPESGTEVRARWLLRAC